MASLKIPRLAATGRYTTDGLHLQENNGTETFTTTTATYKPAVM